MTQQMEEKFSKLVEETSGANNYLLFLKTFSKSFPVICVKTGKDFNETNDS